MWTVLAATSVAAEGVTVVESTVRTLVVDDDADMRLLVSMSLELSTRPVEVVAVADGDRAMDAWRTHRPDVVVMDLRMPGVDGLELATQMLAEDPAQRIVLFSAYVQPGVVATAHRIGVCEVLEKEHLRDLPTVVEQCAQGAPG